MKKLEDLNGPKLDPYFAQRVLAQIESRKQKKSLLIWKFISAASLVFGCCASLYFYKTRSVDFIDYAKAPVNKSVVLQLDSLPQDARILYVSLEIDEGMDFILNDPNLAHKKEITLALDSNAKSLRLPFVFASHFAGKKIVRVKFLDEDFNVVRVDRHYLEFVNETEERKI